MPFPNPAVWTRETADVARENSKREASPSSFFCSQGRSLCLAAEYFTDNRLAVAARGGVAIKHRHKNQLAIFGQMMAAFEYMLKDFVAKTIDATSAFDDKIKSQDWLSITTERVLAQRVVQTSIGSTLIHPTLGWHSPETVNERYKAIFNISPIDGNEIRTLATLWILRHSVAHNAGIVTAHDAARINQPALAERVAHIDDAFIAQSFEFLKGIAIRLADRGGKSVLGHWFKTVRDYGINYPRDEAAYARIKQLATCIQSRTQPLPVTTEVMYQSDWATYTH